MKKRKRGAKTKSEFVRKKRTATRASPTRPARRKKRRVSERFIESND